MEQHSNLKLPSTVFGLQVILVWTPLIIIITTTLCDSLFFFVKLHILEFILILFELCILTFLVLLKNKLNLSFSGEVSTFGIYSISFSWLPFSWDNCDPCCSLERNYFSFLLKQKILYSFGHEGRIHLWATTFWCNCSRRTFPDKKKHLKYFPISLQRKHFKDWFYDPELLVYKRPEIDSLPISQFTLWRKHLIFLVNDP